VRNRIFGGIGVLWGGGLLVSKLISGQLVGGSGAYAGGQLAGLVFAILLFGVGLYYLIKGGPNRPRADRNRLLPNKRLKLPARVD